MRMTDSGVFEIMRDVGHEVGLELRHLGLAPGQPPRQHDAGHDDRHQHPERAGEEHHLTAHHVARRGARRRVDGHAPVRQPLAQRHRQDLLGAIERAPRVHRHAPPDRAPPRSWATPARPATSRGCRGVGPRHPARMRRGRVRAEAAGARPGTPGHRPRPRACPRAPRRPACAGAARRRTGRRRPGRARPAGRAASRRARTRRAGAPAGTPPRSDPAPARPRRPAAS